MNKKSESELIRRPWILLLAVFVGWLLGTLGGYAHAYSKGANNIFDIYADISTLMIWLGITSFIWAFFYTEIAHRYNNDPEQIGPVVIGGCFISLLLIVGALWIHGKAAYLDTGFEGPAVFGRRAEQLAVFRGPKILWNGQYAEKLIPPVEVRARVEAGRLYWDEFLTTIPEKLLTADEKSLIKELGP